MPDITAPAQLPGTMLAEGQSPDDFNQLFGDPLDDDYRKGLEAKDLGEGSEYLDSLVGPPPQPTGPDLSSGAALGAAATIGKDMAGAFTEAGHWAIGGPMKALQSFLDVGKELATTIGGPRILDKDGNFDPKWQSSDEIKARMASGEITPLQLPNIAGVMDTPDTYTAMLLQSLMQFGTGYGAAGKITGIGNSFGGALVKGAMSDAGAFHGNEGNAANLLLMLEQVAPQTMGPINDFVHADALASKETDNNLEGRLKNAMVGVVPNLLIPLVVSGAKLLRAQRVAKELGQAPVVPGQPAVPPVPPSEAIIGAADDPLIARIGQQIGPDDLGVPTHVAAQGLDANSISGKAAAQVEASRPPPSSPVGAGSQTEWPTHAAIKIRGETFEGSTHADALNKAIDKYGEVKVHKWMDEPGAEIDAFITNKGRYVLNDEATKLAGFKGSRGDGRIDARDIADLDLAHDENPLEVLNAMRAEFPSDLPSRSVEAGRATPPPPAEGMVRVYHGGSTPDDYNGPLWFTTHKPYAEGYAQKSSAGRVHYLDLPETHPMFATDYPEQGVKQGFTFAAELPANEIGGRKALPSHSVEAGSGFDTSKVWYHGSGEDFATFKPSGANEALGPGVYISDDPKLASSYANKYTFDPATGKATGYEPGAGMVYKLHARGKLWKYDGDDIPGSMARAAEIMPDGLKGATKVHIGDNPKKFTEALKAAGYDGIEHTWHEGKERFNQAVIFDPANVRSATPGGSGAKLPAVPPSGTPPAPPSGPSPGPFSSEFKFNWSKIETDDDMKMMAGQVMDAFAPELKARGKGVVQTWKETAEKANALSAIDMLIGEGAAKGKALDAVQLEAAGNIYVSALKDLKAATDLAVSPNAGPEDLMAWDHMLRVFKMAQNLYVPAQAEAGRALNILRKTKGESALYSQELQRMVTAMGGEVTLKAKAAALADLLQRGPQTLTPEVLQKSVTAKSLDTVMEMWKAGLLTGPKTHIVNFLSNSQVLLTTIAERKVAGMIGEIIDPITGVKAEEAAFMAWGQKQHLREAFRVMAKTFKTGVQEWGGNQVEAPRVPMMSSEHWGVPSNSMLGKGIDMMGTVYTLPFRALGASDAFFKELHYGAELKATALRQATEEVSRGKIAPTQFHLRLQELLDNPTQALRAQARDFAAYNTFTNEPGDILRKIDTFRNFDNPAARFAAHFVMPFTNTPGKILGFFVDRSPLGLLSAKLQKELQAGGAGRDIALAKMGVGTITLGVGFDLAMDGFVTGGGPAKNDNKRQALMRGGWRPWSIKVPTGEMQDDGITPVYVYAPINRFDPAATPLLLGAALAEMTKYTDGKANRQMDEIWAAGTMALADVMMSKTTMMGFANFVEAMSNPSQAADKYMKNAARSVVPAGANWAKEEFTDPVMRQAWDLVSAAQSKVPYLSESVPPRLDMWGREMTKEQILGQPWDALIPSRMASTKDALPIDRELLRLNKAMRYPSFIPIKGRNIPLDNLPEAQNRLVTLMNAKASDLLSDENQEVLAEARKGHVVRSLEQFENRTLVDALQEMIKGEGPLGEDYLQSPDEDKGDLISSVKSKYEQAARVQVLREFPQIKSIRDSLPAKSEKGIEGAF